MRGDHYRILTGGGESGQTWASLFCLPRLLISQNSCHDLGVKILTLLAVLLALALSALGADCSRNQPQHRPQHQPKTEAALIELEQNWAAALSRNDADTVACMVADEFEEVDVDGSLHTRSQMLEHIPQRKPGTNHLSEMRAHVEGNSGFTRGLATLVDASGKVVARVRFTDVFTYRDGRWQALAGHETLLGEASR
jgi:ketosteroid isomerase-like protein